MNDIIKALRDDLEEKRAALRAAEEAIETLERLFGSAPAPVAAPESVKQDKPPARASATKPRKKPHTETRMSEACPSCGKPRSDFASGHKFGAHKRACKGSGPVSSPQMSGENETAGPKPEPLRENRVKQERAEYVYSSAFRCPSCGLNRVFRMWAGSDEWACRCGRTLKAAHYQIRRAKNQAEAAGRYAA